MRTGLSRGVALAGLVCLSALILLQPPRFDTAGLAASAPLGMLFIAGLMPLSRWAIVTAILMLPYFCYGVMVILTEPVSRWYAIGLSALTIGVFLAALDVQRRGQPV